MAFPTMKIGNYTFTGASIAGTFTALACKELSLSFDVGNGPSFLIGKKNFFLTHGHADHAAGLPYLLSMKALSSHDQAQVYVPERLKNPMQDIVSSWEKIEDHKYNYEINGVELDKEYPLKGPHFVRAFPTYHRVPSNGYTVFQRKKKLRKEFLNKSREEILQAKEKNLEVHESIETPMISFTGDTKIEFFDARPWVKKSKTLFVEVSFIDEARTIEETRHWGHIHLDEIIPRLEEFEGDQIVFIHLSARYKTSQFEAILKKKLPSETLQKVIVFPRHG